MHNRRRDRSGLDGVVAWAVRVAIGAALLLPLSGCGDADTAPAPGPETGSRAAIAKAKSRSFTQDAQAQADLAAIQRDLEVFGFPTAAQVDRLRELYAQYPTSDPVISTFDRALHQLQDFNGLYELHRSLPAAKQTPYHRFYLGSILNGLGRFEEASRELLPLAAKHPRDPQVAIETAVALVSLQRSEEARRVLETAGSAVFQHSPKAAHMLMGDIHMSAGELEKARQDYQAAIAAADGNDPEVNRLYLQLSRVLQRLGREQEAQAALDRAKQLSEAALVRKRWDAARTALLVAWRAGQYERANIRIEELLEMADDPATRSMCHLVRHRVHAALGASEQAAADLQKAEFYRDQARQEGKVQMTAKARDMFKTADLMAHAEAASRKGPRMSPR